MTIGLTYDLRSEYLARGYSEEETAELDRDDTVAAIEEAVRRAGHATDRIGSAGALAERLSKNHRWDLVFNICEGLYGLGREALVPAMLDAHRIPYTFSDPAVLALSLHKAMTKRVVRDLGVPTPDFAVVDRPEDVDGVRLAYPLFAKPLAEGTGKGIDAASKIETPAELRTVCAGLLAKFRQPVLVEEFLPGREFTAGIVGTGAAAEVVGVMEVILNKKAEAGAYSYVNKEECDDRVVYRLAEGDIDRECRQIALKAWRGLGARDAGRVDLRVARDGKVSFIEVNPLAGLHPQHSDLPIICTMVGVTFQQLIERILESAISRVRS
ncbi:MAG: D-alanine--D-alanine ligase [Spirochaetes bacterium RBG_13_68_11]|nr:MAG: D-alanine--D-alanine ligase [Spirochaetes bacterium RBG_13_68_11]